jgi:hypothetical protein
MDRSILQLDRYVLTRVNDCLGLGAGCTRKERVHAVMTDSISQSIDQSINQSINHCFRSESWTVERALFHSLDREGAVN